MTGTRGGRWPPRPGRGDPPPAAGPEFAVDWPGAIGDLSRALERLAPTAVLGEATYLLDASGGAAEQYRAPFAALAVTSGSAGQLLIASGTRQGAAPGPGPGLAVVPPGGHIAVNMKGYSWALYGGAAGDLVTVQAFTRPVPPLASEGAWGPVKTLWQNFAGAGPGANLNANGAGPVVNTAAFSHLGLLVSVLTAPTGITPTLTVAVDGLDAAGNQYFLGATLALTAAGTVGIPIGPGTNNGFFVPALAQVTWTLGGTTPDFPNVELTLQGRP